MTVISYLASVLISTGLSTSWDVSLWGDVPGQDSYSAYTVVAYILLFGVIATHLKTEAQIWRLLGAVVVMGVLVAGYAVVQHYGHDFLDLMEPPGAIRTTSTMGNAIFAGAVMLLTIPITLTVASRNLETSVTKARSWWILCMWSLVLTVQLLGITFTSSRGPWLGTIFGLTGLIGLVIIFLRWPALSRPVGVLALAVAISSAIVLIPSIFPDQDDASGGPPSVSTVVAGRVSNSIAGGAGGGIAGRAEIWKKSAELMKDRPWFEFDSLSLFTLRPLIGYGPDLFRPTYLLKSPSTEADKLPHEVAHAHNFFVHQGVELGLLGLLASSGLFLVVFLLGIYQLMQPGKLPFPWQKLVLIGLLAALGGRFVEQMVGVARVSDLTIFWVLVAVFVALPAIRQAPEAATEPASQFRREPGLSRPQSRLLPKLSPYYWTFFWRWGAVVVLVAGIGALTWLKSINYVRAAVIVDSAAAQFRNGESQAALSSLDRAIDMAPDVTTYYGHKTTVLLGRSESSRPKEELECPRPRNALSLEACLVQQALESSLEWVNQRPLQFRSRLALADASLRLAVLNEDSDLSVESIPLYREVAEMVPNSWAIWNRVAEVYIASNQPKAALLILDKSLQITEEHENSRDAWLLQAEAYRTLGEHEKAVEAAEKFVARLPASSLPHHSLARIYFETGRYQDALTELDVAIRLSPPENPYPEAYSLRGMVYHQLGRYQTAIRDLDQAITQGMEGPLLRNDRGLAYARLGQFSRAEEDFSQAIRLDPQLALSYNNRGFANRELGRLEEAIQDLNKAIQLDPSFQMAYYNRALTNTLLGLDAKAKLDGEWAVELGFDPVLLQKAVNELRKRP